MVVFDRTNFDLLYPYIKNIDYTILDTRYESINIFILLKALFKKKFKTKFFDYTIEYVKQTKCKFIVTYVDNNINFYYIKNYIPDICSISVQNGLRTEYFFEELKKHKNLKVDYLFCYNQFYASEFKKYIKGDKFYSGGDLKDSPAEITDTYIIHNMKPTAKNKRFWHKIKINRKTGHIDQEWGQGNDLRVHNTGVCEKATENKF